jgi:hypothetical protein
MPRRKPPCRLLRAHGHCHALSALRHGGLCGRPLCRIVPAAAGRRKSRSRPRSAARLGGPPWSAMPCVLLPRASRRGAGRECARRALSLLSVTGARAGSVGHGRRQGERGRQRVRPPRTLSALSGLSGRSLCSLWPAHARVQWATYAGREFTCHALPLLSLLCVASVAGLCGRRTRGLSGIPMPFISASSRRQPRSARSRSTPAAGPGTRSRGA